MLMIVCGILLWVAAHLFKRVAPEMRASLTERLGNASNGVMALLIVLSVVLMVFGYKSADTNFVYQLGPWAKHINHLLMFLAVILMGAGSSKGRARTLLRHPMLTGFAIWAVAHLLVNGDTASLLLFGGLGIWAIASMLIINRAEGPWERPAAGPIQGDVKLLVISVVVFIVIVVVHSFVGPSPFAGSS